MQIPENKIARLFINIVFVAIWLPTALYLHVCFAEFIEDVNYKFYQYFLNVSIYIFISAAFAPVVFGTRYIWFKKTRSKIFNGFFDQFK